MYATVLWHITFHDFYSIPLFPACPDPFRPGKSENMESEKTTFSKPYGLVPNPKARLREQVWEVMRFHHFAIRTFTPATSALTRVCNGKSDGASSV
jgi:hypothetical protein